MRSTLVIPCTVQIEGPSTDRAYIVRVCTGGERSTVGGEIRWLRSVEIRAVASRNSHVPVRSLSTYLSPSISISSVYVARSFELNILVSKSTGTVRSLYLSAQIWTSIIILLILGLSRGLRIPFLQMASPLEATRDVYGLPKSRSHGYWRPQIHAEIGRTNAIPKLAKEETRKTIF